MGAARAGRSRQAVQLAPLADASCKDKEDELTMNFRASWLVSRS